MSIWFDHPTLETQNELRNGTILEQLDIVVTEIGSDSLTGTMPVDERTFQPYRILHGGASVVLAESLGSIAANMAVDPEKFYCVGLEVNANHLRPATSGLVTGVAKAVHIGRTTQVWNIEIRNEAGKLVNVSRLTMAVVAK